MCTVSIIPTPGGLRARVNRDESHERAPALPPRVATAGVQRALMPIDPVGGGTWVAASDAGLFLTLLNYAPGHAPNPAPAGRRSRGLIIPQLAGARHLTHAREQLQSLDLRDTSPFRLVLADARSVLEVRAPGFGAPMRFDVHAIDRPLVFASSGLGDQLVEPPRRELAQQLFAQHPWASAQDLLHHHRWPDRAHLSVYMLRAEARTVSITTVELDGDLARMAYAPETAGAFAPETVASLPRRAPEGAR